MIASLLILLFIYLLAMAWVYAGMTRLPYFQLKHKAPSVRFSIVVVFRNEAENLPHLLNSLILLQYPRDHFEILWVNDASDDDSEEIISNHLSQTNLNFKIFQNQRYSKSPKKDAITLAVKQAQFDWILTTDADCKIPPQWLHFFNEFVTVKKSKMVGAPILFETDETLLQQFQFWDGMSLQAAAMAGFGWGAPILNNAANLAFSKDAFFEVNGYEGNNHLASGDDIFLMEKIKTLYPDQIHYLKNSASTVITLPVDGVKKLVTQRIRWASKTSKNKNIRAQVLGMIVLLTNFGFILALVACFIDPMNANYYVFFLLIKFLADLSVLRISASFFEKSLLSPFLFPSNISYSFMVVWVFMNSWSGSYEWKGRSFKK